MKERKKERKKEREKERKRERKKERKKERHMKCTKNTGTKTKVRQKNETIKMKCTKKDNLVETLFVHGDEIFLWVVRVRQV